jgi:5-methylcytosine-specific restriction endonuclease McrA
MTPMYLDIFNSKRELVAHLIAAQDNECYLCLDEFSQGNPPTVDHITPLSRGGTWELDNLALAHKICNTEKGNRLFLDDGTLEPRRKRKRNGYRNRPKMA